MASFWPGQYPVMCPTVWRGRCSSVVVAPDACRDRLHMSHRLDLPFLNLLVKAFTGKLLVMICISLCLSSVLVLEDFRFFVDGLPAAGFPYKEISGFGGGGWYSGSVRFGRKGVCILMIF